ncbi:sporulation protein YpjB [Paenibacillus pini]|uniref:Sporulation protein YpjB n=1 Tax=Paenibacillus pini JCM 16418 TaxID=1236976 RepID=W7YWR3_9BACL|nr:sporulation protein YpjB [Paenibacillus pini]GAF09086.1 hypothetical protein JCM16418_3204 [Paenibacillus pini JCM 16418]
MLRIKLTWQWAMVLLILLGSLYYGSSSAWAYQADDEPLQMNPVGSPLVQAERLDTASETLYQHVLEGNINLVQQDIREVAQIFESSSLQGLTTVEGIHAIAESIVEMKEATVQARIQEEQWLTASAKLRMAADSLSHPRQPVWLQYYKVIREDLNNMNVAVVAKDKQGLKNGYESLRRHYEVIRPAVIIQRKNGEIAIIDSWVSYAGGIISSTSTASMDMSGLISQGEEQFNGLFGKKKDEPALASLDSVNTPWPWVVWSGSFILIILAYAGYRKYRGEQNTFQSVEPKPKF